MDQSPHFLTSSSYQALDSQALTGGSSVVSNFRGAVDFTPSMSRPDVADHHVGELVPSQRRLKRCLDVAVASVAFLIFALPMAVIALLIKMESKGPVLYGQERIGHNGRKFIMWKFRSMRVGAESQTGAVWAIKNDPRRTKFGCFLRASSLDELPQLLNVFKGDMAVVGPRPERPVFVETFKKTIHGYGDRHQVPVGITGWAQVHGWRGNTSIEKRLDYDLYYIRHWSLWLDIKTLFLTLFRGFINKNAY